MHPTRKARRLIDFARKILAMSFQDAKEVLGFPPNSNPSPADIKKAYRAKALANHPDRGGSHEVMVEINTARDILEGNRREDREPMRKRAPTPEDAEAKKRIRRDVRAAGIKHSADQLSASLSAALRWAIPAEYYRIEFSTYLTDDYAAVLDALHEEMEAKRDPHPDMVAAEALCQKLSSRALRLAHKFATLQKDKTKLDDAAFVDDEPVTLAEVERLYADSAKLVKDFLVFRAESGQLMSLMVTSEFVPLAWDDQYSKSHQIILAFAEDFAKFDGRGLLALQAQWERSADATMAVLDEFQITGAPKDWHDWKFPSTFEKAERDVRGS